MTAFLGIAFGNVIGSNISNLGPVLGAAAIMSPIAIQGEVIDHCGSAS